MNLNISLQWQKINAFTIKFLQKIFHNVSVASFQATSRNNLLNNSYIFYHLCTYDNTRKLSVIKIAINLILKSVITARIKNKLTLLQAYATNVEQNYILLNSSNYHTIQMLK